MKNNNQNLHRWFFIIACLIFVVGFITTPIICKQSNILQYPTMITEAYDQAQNHIIVPGEKEVNLKRTGAYGIYYINELMNPGFTEEEITPAIDCVLISRVTDQVIKAVPDYVKTNRYRDSDQSIGVLIMSITVDEPGIYTFSCDCKGGLQQEEIHVALGPNYFWEFLHLTWKSAGPLLGGITILCGSFVLTFLFLIIGVVIKLLLANKSNNSFQDISIKRKSG